MSLDATRWAWTQKGLRPLHKLILLSLADRAGADGKAYPSKDQLIADTGADQKTIWQGLKALQEAGLIVDSKERKGSTGQIVVWQLLGIEFRHSNDSENGTVKGFRKRKDSENGRIPKTDSKDSENGMGKDSENGMGKDSENGMGNLPTEPTIGTNQGTDQRKTGGKRQNSPSFGPAQMPELTEQQAAEFLAYRKAKEAPLTETAWKRLLGEFAKAGVDPVGGVGETMARGWRGFKAEWMQPKENAPVVGQGQPGRMSAAGTSRQFERGNAWAAEESKRLFRQRMGLEPSTDDRTIEGSCYEVH